MYVCVHVEPIWCHVCMIHAVGLFAELLCASSLHVTHCSCAELPQRDADRPDEHTTVTRRSRHAHTIAFSTTPSTMGIPPSTPPPAAPLPRTTAPPTLSPPTAARYIVQCRMCTPFVAMVTASLHSSTLST